MDINIDDRKFQFIRGKELTERYKADLANTYTDGITYMDYNGELFVTVWAPDLGVMIMYNFGKFVSLDAWFFFLYMFNPLQHKCIKEPAGKHE